MELLHQLCALGFPELLHILLYALLSEQPVLSKEACDATINEWLAGKGLGYGKCMNPFRVAVIGYAKGPHMLDVAEIIGKEETLTRLQRAIDLFPTIIGQ